MFETWGLETANAFNVETVKTVFLQVADVFANINLFPDVIDILLVALLAYALITQLRKSQSIQVIKGIIFVEIVIIKPF